MSEFKNKIDFAVLFTVDKANPNGDPLDGNRPRMDVDGYGEMSDVCIKRKIRNRLQDMGEKIFVQSQDRADDGLHSLAERADANKELIKHKKDKFKDEYTKIACKSWIDVRSFGQLFAFKSKSNASEEKDSISASVRGPVTVRTAVSVSPVDVSTMQITKSVNGGTSDRKGPDTMGSKNRVEFGLYKFCGSINHQLAEKTGFSEEDAEKIKEALVTLFENDASAARPDGSMEVKKEYWWKHNCEMGQYSSAKVHNSLHVNLLPEVVIPKKYEDYEVTLDNLEGLEVEVIEGR